MPERVDLSGAVWIDRNKDGRSEASSALRAFLGAAPGKRRAQQGSTSPEMLLGDASLEMLLVNAMRHADLTRDAPWRCSWQCTAFSASLVMSASRTAFMSCRRRVLSPFPHRRRKHACMAECQSSLDLEKALVRRAWHFCGSRGVWHAVRSCRPRPLRRGKFVLLEPRVPASEVCGGQGAR